jgi:hypothetical protein
MGENDMYNDTQLYELSYILPNKEKRTKPRIVFTVRLEHFEEIYARMDRVAHLFRNNASTYCGFEVTFARPTSDLFGTIEFGYEKCGFVCLEDGYAHFHVQLNEGERLYCSTLTMKLLTMVLAVPIEGRKSNHLQQVDLELRCEHSTAGYGHAVGGYISSRLMQWLLKKAKHDKNAPMPKEVIRAMKETWSAISLEGQKHWKNHCHGLITPDGRFMLECFGDACDIAIYPDEMRREDYTRFSCHNLDSAKQQVTLLSGLAKMCELAREEETN